MFFPASQSKPIVGVAMMLLWEQGKWLLDDPVAKRIPEFADLKVATPSGEVPRISPMTMRQLMSHSAGFDDTRGYENANVDLGNRPPARDDSDLQEMIDKLAKLPFAVQPGSDFRYGPSVDIQGHIIEKLSGQSLDVFLQTKIFEPLGRRESVRILSRCKNDKEPAPQGPTFSFLITGEI